jgi:serine/threonine-protein kinase HipA
VSLLLESGGWRLAPAYDLLWSAGPGGEHSMAIAGRGNPDLAAVLDVAKQAGIAPATARAIVAEVSAAVIDGWPEVAPSKRARARIARHLIALG